MKKAVIDYKFDGKIRIFALIGIAVAVSAFPYAFVFGDFRLGWLYTLLSSFAFFFIGYGLQMLAAKLFHYKRVKSDGSYENTESFIDFRHMLFALLTSLVPTVVLMVILIPVFTADMEITYLYSWVPYVLAIFTYGISIAGIIVWFFPVERLCDRRAVTCCALLDFGLYVVVIFLMQKYIPLFTMITNPKNARAQLAAGETFNIYGIASAVAAFVILLTLQFIHDRHYSKLNALMKDYVHEQRRENRKKWEPKD